MEKPLKATLKEAISEKSGKSYCYVSLMLTDTLEKRVFLEQSEIECIKLSQSQSVTHTPVK